MATTKVSLGVREAISGAAPGTTEFHYGHAFVVQEDLTLVCDMDDGFVAAEVEAGRVKVCKPAAEAPKVVDKPKAGKKTIEVTPPPDTGENA